MRKLYKLFLAPAMLYSASSSYLYAGNTNDFDLQTEMLPNGDINLTSSINKTNNACIYLSYVQILRNYEAAIDTDIDGTPILSRWETVWENTAINKYSTGIPKVNAQRAKNICQSNNQNNSLSGSIISAALNLVGAEGNNDQSAFQNNSFILKQGEEFLGSKQLNQSSNYEDAELKVSAIYVKTSNKNLLQFTPTGPSVNRGNYKVSTHVINLKDTKDEVTLSANHHFKYPGFVQGKDVPLAYVASGQNQGCLGQKVSNNNNASSAPAEGENPAMRSSLRNTNNGPKFDCYYATRSSQKANETPQVILRQRTEKDVLIMCPGSTIPDELNYNRFKANNIEIPTSKASPYLQVMASTTPRWCHYLEKAERKWTNLHSVSNEGWLISQNSRTKNLECIAQNNECANTLYGNSNLKNIINNPSSLIRQQTLVLTNQPIQFCQYKDGSSANCTEQFNSSENKSINDLIQTLQFESMRRSIN